MANIAPFRGLRFNAARIPDLSRVVAPPYDVIDPALEDRLRARDEHNVVRITMGKTPPGGRPEAEYARAADLLSRWRRDSVLMQDAEPCIYVIEQKFNLREEPLTRVGFIACLLLEELGKGSIHPHEHTTKAAKGDMFNLMTACKGALSQVMAVYSDPGGALDRQVASLCADEPLLAFDDGEGVQYRLWRVGDPDSVQCIVQPMRDRSVFIADGHHRYESAFEYRRLHRSSVPPRPAPEDYITALCISVGNEGLRILPTHRRVRTARKIEEKAIRKALEPHFTISRARSVASLLESSFEAARQGRDSIGCYLSGDGLFMLEPRKIDSLRQRFPQAAESWWRLPVSLLHYVVIPDLLGFQPGSREETANVDYRHDAQEVVQGVNDGDFGVGFLLPPLHPSTVERVALAGQRLPPKSTFFYPKIASGLLMYCFGG